MDNQKTKPHTKYRIKWWFNTKQWYIGYLQFPINLDAKNEISISSPSILLGNGNRKKAEPLLKGDITYEVLTNIIEALLEITNELSVLAGKPQNVPFLELNVTSKTVNKDLYDVLVNKLTKIRSNISKTE